MGIFDKFGSHHEQAPVAPPAPASSGGIINLKKTAKIVLDKKQLGGVKAAVYLVLDYSGSMSRFYKDHTVQDFTEKILAVALNMDDDGSVPVTLFSTQAYQPFTVTEANYHGAVDVAVARAGRMGTTNYAAAMRSIVAQHEASGATEPALVIFQTDGSPDSRREAEQVLIEASSLPIFWQFVGFGNDSFDFLHKLDDLRVDPSGHGKRIIDNAGFFKAGNDPKAMSPEVLYDNILNEFPEWLAKAKAQGILH